MNIFDNYLPMPECNREYYSIWLENGSDNHRIQGRREGCAEGESCGPGRWVGRGAENAKKKYKITVLWNKVGVFLRKIVVHLAPFLYHRRMAMGTLLVIIIYSLE